jgi:hypothetical protein
MDRSIASGAWASRFGYQGAGAPGEKARHGRIGFGEQIEIRQGAEIGRPSVLYATVVGGASR